MNRRHSALTDWGLEHVRVGSRDVVLDVGCGGGRTIEKLAGLTSEGKVYGIDHAEESVAAARRLNERLIQIGRVDVRQTSVSNLPFDANTFDLVTAIETHFWWPDMDRGMREIERVLKPGGQVAVIAEFYNGGKHARYATRLMKATKIAALDVDQHRELLSRAGFLDVKVSVHEPRGWICAVGTKPTSSQEG